MRTIFRVIVASLVLMAGRIRTSECGVVWYKLGAASSIIILKFEAAIGGAIFIRCPALGALGARLRSGGGLDLEAGFAGCRERRRDTLFGRLGDEVVDGDELGDLLPVLGVVEARDVGSLWGGGVDWGRVSGSCKRAVVVGWLHVCLGE
jgi:hypothetical protein